MIHSYQMFNALLAQSWLFFHQNKQAREDGLPTCSLEIAALFTPKCGRDLCSSLMTSLRLALGILNDRTPQAEHLKKKAHNKTWAFN